MRDGATLLTAVSCKPVWLQTAKGLRTRCWGSRRTRVMAPTVRHSPGWAHARLLHESRKKGGGAEQTQIKIYFPRWRWPLAPRVSASFFGLHALILGPSCLDYSMKASSPNRPRSLLPAFLHLTMDRRLWQGLVKALRRISLPRLLPKS